MNQAVGLEISTNTIIVSKSKGNFVNLLSDLKTSKGIITDGHPHTMQFFLKTFRFVDIAKLLLVADIIACNRLCSTQHTISIVQISAMELCRRHNILFISPQDNVKCQSQ